MPQQEAPQQDSTNANDIRDQLPTDLNASEFVGVYKFPDNSRRRIPGYIYLGLGVAIIALVVVMGSDGPFINEAVGFAVGHASAQQVWRGFRSRPTWRVLCYSNEDPPTRRGLVLVDAVNGKVVEHLTQENLEDWS